MKKVCFLFFIFYAASAIAQVDSLRQLLSVSSGQAKFDLLNTLTVLDSGSVFREYNQEAIQMAKRSGKPAMEIAAWSAMGDHFYEWGSLDSALFFYTKGLKIAREKKLVKEEILCLEKSGAAYEENFQAQAALRAYTELLNVSRQTRDKMELAGALEKMGLFYLNQRNYDAALQSFTEQLVYETGDSSKLAACYNNIGLVYYHRGDFVNCIRFYQRTLDIKKRLNESWAVGQAELNLGIAFKEQGVYDLALYNLLQAARLFEKEPASIELASCYSTIGNLFVELDSTGQALDYHLKALNIREEIKHSPGIARSLTNIGNVYKLQGDYTLAQDYLLRSLNIKKEIGDQVTLAYSLNLLGEVCFLQRDFTGAENYYQQAFDLQRVAEDPKGEAATLNDLGQLYYEWGKYDLAKTALDESREIARRIGAKQVLLENYEITIRLLRKNGNAEQVILIYDEYLALKDSVLDEQKAKAITGLQIQYETEKKEKEISVLNEREKTSRAVVERQHIQIYSLTIGAVLLVIITALLLNAYRSRRKAHRQSQLIIEQKQTMLSELHHRIKNNLQVLSSILDLQQDRTDDESSKSILKAVELRLNAMLLIHKDLYGEKIDGQVDMKKYITTLTEHLLSAYGYKKETVRTEFAEQNLLLDADLALSLGFICNEIISNAFKHAFRFTNDPQLRIQMKTQKNRMLLEISDNGPGFPDPKEINNSSSFGIRLIHLFANDIQAETKINSDKNGTRFQFTFPYQETDV